jgi:hypothetical protein
MWDKIFEVAEGARLDKAIENWYAQNMVAMQNKTHPTMARAIEGVYW